MNKENLGLTHFLNVAKRGAFPGTSGGEKIANKLAKALDSLGDDLALLDSDVIEGTCTMLRLMAGPYPTDEHKGKVFALIHEAATGKRVPR